MWKFEKGKSNRSMAKNFKVGLSTFKKISAICLIESPLKMMKNAFYFILKALFRFQDI